MTPHDPSDTTPRWGEVGIHGIPRPAAWDAVLLVETHGPPGDEAVFAVAPSGAVYDGAADPAPWLAPLAAPLAERVPPPLRAHAVRRGPGLWAVGGRSVETVELTDDPGGSWLELAVVGGTTVLRIDGIPSFRPVPELERAAAGRSREYVASAHRLGGAAWELRVDPI